MSQITLESLDDTRRLARELAEKAGLRRLLLLDGPMGAGKTQFTRFFIEALGGTGASSPSFALHNSYVTPHGGVEHFDLFRLESADDLESTGFWDFFALRSGILIVEWADRLNEFGLDGAIPRDWPRFELRFAVSGDASRVVELGEAKS